jgi:hypothetical protein
MKIEIEIEITEAEAATLSAEYNWRSNRPTIPLQEILQTIIADKIAEIRSEVQPDGVTLH